MAESIWNDPRITAYVLGDLSDEEKTKFENELGSDPELSDAVAEARGVTEQLRTHFASERAAVLDTGRRQTVLAAAAGSDPVAGSDPPAGSAQAVVLPSRDAWWRRHGVLLGIAASLLIVIVGLSVPAMQSVRQLTQQDVVWQVDQAPENGEWAAAMAPEDLATDAFILRESVGGTPSPSEPFGRPAVPSSPASVPSAQSREKSARYAQSGNESLERKSGAVAGPADGRARGTDAWYFDQRSAADPAGPTEKGFLQGGMAMGVDLDQSRLSANDGRGRLPELGRPGAVSPMEMEMGGMGMGGMGGGMGMGGMMGGMPAGGRGPGMAGDRFEPITDNPFKRVVEHPLSTFSADVDTASYSKLRDVLIRAQQPPRPDAVRIEEMINYFEYGYEPPAADAEHPLAARIDIVSCPWNESHRLARVAIKGRTIETGSRPACNLVFLIDTSGSMNAPNRLPLVLDGIRMLLTTLNPHDRVAIVTYAGSAGLVLDSTPASRLQVIREALDRLSAGGSTNGGAGIRLAYQTARDHLIPGGANRVILCSDGDFNVGVTGTDELIRVVEEEARSGIFLTVLGFGMGNHNDAMLEQISGRGNGNYAFIDSQQEARKVLVQQVDGTLFTIAKDVKLQVEFNPRRVAAYRLIGYENRVLAKEDFNDDRKDAGEVGAGHTVTAFYEIVPAGVEPAGLPPAVDELKYQTELAPTPATEQDETLTVKIRYKAPDGDVSRLVEFPAVDSDRKFAEADDDLRFAASVAGLGMKLRRSPYAGTWTFRDITRTASAAIGEDRDGLRAEFLYLTSLANRWFGPEPESPESPPAASDAPPAASDPVPEPRVPAPEVSDSAPEVLDPAPETSAPADDPAEPGSDR